MNLKKEILKKSSIEGFKADKNGDLKRDRDPRDKNFDDNTKNLEQIKKSGTFTKFVFAFVDFIIVKTVEFINNLFEMFLKDGFKYFSTEENTKIDKKKLARTSVYISYDYFRILITLLIPPLGIFLCKGLNGWVNIFVSIILCYFNYFLGILYGFFVTFNNRYADLYIYNQKKRINEYKKELKEEDNIDLDKRKNMLPAILMLIVVLSSVFILFIYLFAKIKNRV